MRLDKLDMTLQVRSGQGVLAGGKEGWAEVGRGGAGRGKRAQGSASFPSTAGAQAHARASCSHVRTPLWPWPVATAHGSRGGG